MSAPIGTPAPDFALRDQDRNLVSPADLRGRKALIVFFPFAFSGVCEGELCTIRDNLHSFGSADAEVVAISCDHLMANKAWSDKEGFGFRILSDYWPHGAVAQAYGCFNEKVGCAMRATYVLDEDGIVRAIISSEELGQPREFTSYQEALAAI
ncbi:MAG: peroxiredoxin [Acidimicrobiia bacterium]|nr:peroxiredoxin [Acidimicrobiia bacterium]MDH4308593.1 peroxiredoxin [Acidimicrobiia bacterium]